MTMTLAKTICEKCGLTKSEGCLFEPGTDGHGLTEEGKVRHTCTGRKYACIFVGCSVTSPSLGGIITHNNHCKVGGELHEHCKIKK